MFDAQKENEENRIRAVYKKRDTSGKRSLYGWNRADALFNQYRFRAVTSELLKAAGFADLANIDVLDVGCGNGNWLRTLLEWGGSPNRLHGIDLLQDRIVPG